jgi:hypothetical protein
LVIRGRGLLGAEWLEIAHPTPGRRFWLGDGGPLGGRRSVAEVVVGHVCKPVVTDHGDVAVECHSIYVVGDLVARDHNRRRHCNREQHDPGGRHYAGIRVTGKVVLSDPVPDHDDAADVLQRRMAMEDEAGVSVAARLVVGKEIVV